MPCVRQPAGYPLAGVGCALYPDRGFTRRSRDGTLNPVSNTNINLERQLRRLRLAQNLRNAFFGALVLVPLACFLWWFYIGQAARSNADLAGSVPQQSNAEVLAVGYPKRPRLPGLPPSLVSLRLRGRVTQARSFARLRPGQQVVVVYRVGKSGRLYVETIKP